MSDKEFDHEFVNVPLPDGAMTIQRTENGWILGTVNAYEGIVRVRVYQDPEVANSERHSRAISFAAMLEDDDLVDVFQTKWAGGIVVKIEPEGREAE